MFLLGSLSNILTRLAKWWLEIDSEQNQPVDAPKDDKAKREAWDFTLPPSPVPGSIPAVLPTAVSDPATNEIHLKDLNAKIHDWNFSVFDALDRSNGRPLFHFTIGLLEKEGLLRGWKLDERKVRRFLTAVEQQYCQSNPYHNNVHAADVTQAAAIIMRSGPMRLLNPLERFSLIIAAAVHDLAHPGVTNAFLVRTRHESALIYNDRSVNENMHVSTAFRTAEDPELNIFDGLSKEEYARARQLIIAMVLSTDMEHHFELLKQFEEFKQKQGGEASEAWADWNLPLQMILHLADLANPMRDVQCARSWAALVVTECLQQGDLERNLGLEVAPMFDREAINVPQLQLFFIRNFLRPTLEACRGMCSSFVDMGMANLKRTEDFWQTQAATDGSVAPGLAGLQQ